MSSGAARRSRAVAAAAASAAPAAAQGRDGRSQPGALRSTAGAPLGRRRRISSQTSGAAGAEGSAASVLWGGLLLLVSPIDGYAVTAATGDILQLDPGADTIDATLLLAGDNA